MAKSRREIERSKARRASARQWADEKDVRSEPTSIKLLEGMEFAKLKTAGVVTWDFMPFKAGKNNPDGDEGFEVYKRTYECHPRVPTPDGAKPFVCRKKVFGKKCAICDLLMEKGNHMDPDLRTNLRLQLRHLWLVNDSPGNKKFTWKVFDSAHFNRGQGFGEQMKDAINSLKEGEEPFLLDGGYSVVMKVKEMPAFPGGRPWMNAVRIDLHKRSYEYPEKLLDEAPCLDDCLVDPGYDTVKKLLESGDSDDSSEDEDREELSRNGKAKSKTTRKPSPPEDEDEDEPEEDSDTDEEEDEKECPYSVGDTVEHEDYGECKVVSVSDDGTSMTLKDKKDRKHKGISPDDVQKVEEEEDDSDGDDLSTRKGSRDDDEDDGDSEDSSPLEEDEDEPAPPKKRGRKPSK